MAEVREHLLRCAIYTRKSTEEGLEQSFHTLQAQREAAEAYILSHREEGWRTVPALYDDGGWSGANLERPALHALAGAMWKRAASIAWWSTKWTGSAVRCSTSHAYCRCLRSVA